MSPSPSSKKATPRILIVDDVIPMGEWLKSLLDGEFRVTVANSASQARELALRSRPDMVLLDEVLPGESAYDVLLEWHKDQIPVFLLTGMSKAEHVVPPEARGRVNKPRGLDEPGGARDGERFSKEVYACFKKLRKE